MDAKGVKALASRLGVYLHGPVPEEGWTDISCLLAPWTHPTGKDNRPSAGISSSVQGPSFYKCHACHESGTISRALFLLADFSGDPKLRALAVSVDREEAFKHSIRAINSLVQGRESRIKPLPDSLLTKYPPLSYFDRPFRYVTDTRGISVMTALGLGLTYDPRDDRVVFPVWHNGDLVGMTGRSLRTDQNNNSQDIPKVKDYFSLPKREVMLSTRRGPKREILSGYAAQNSSPILEKAIIVVEGLFDFARLVDLGFRRTVAILGSAMTPPKLRLLEEWGCPVIWMVDNDAAGAACLYGPLQPQGRDHTRGAISGIGYKLPQFLPPYLQDPYTVGEKFKKFSDPGGASSSLLLQQLKNIKLAHVD